MTKIVFFIILAFFSEQNLHAQTSKPTRLTAQELSEAKSSKGDNPIHFGYVHLYSQENPRSVCDSLKSLIAEAVWQEHYFDESNMTDAYIIVRTKQTKLVNTGQEGRRRFESEAILNIDIINVSEDLKLASTVISCIGHGRSERGSYLNAISHMDLSGTLLPLLRKATIHMNEYYEKQAPKLIETAKVFEKNGEFGKVVHLLNQIPSSCSLYAEATNMATQAMCDLLYFSSIEYMNKARYEWNLAQNKTGMLLAMEQLSQIPRGTPLDKQVADLTNTMMNKVKSQERQRILREQQILRDTQAKLKWTPELARKKMESQKKEVYLSKKDGMLLLGLMTAFAFAPLSLAAPATPHILAIIAI